jgi:hypothetical protein
VVLDKSCSLGTDKLLLDSLRMEVDECLEASECVEVSDA